MAPLESSSVAEVAAAVSLTWVKVSPEVVIRTVMVSREGATEASVVSLVPG